MKKFLTCCYAFVAAFGLCAAEYDDSASRTLESKMNDQAGRFVQGYGEADAAVVAEAEKFLAETEFKTDVAKRRYLQVFRHLTFIKNPKLPFADWKAIYDAKIEELKFEQKLNTSRYLGVLLPWYAPHCCKDGYEAMIAFPDWKTFVDSPYWCIRNGKWQEAYDAFLVNQKQIARVIRMCMTNLQDPAKAMEAAKTLALRDCTVKELNDGLVAIQDTMVNSGKFTDEQMKELFNSLNRKYSGKLVDDEVTWTPVVKRIRTMLGTY